MCEYKSCWLKFLLFLLILSGIKLSAFTQEDTISMFYPVQDTIVNNFGLFESDELLEVTLRFDITWYMKNKPEEEYIDAILTYHFNERDSINKKIRLRSRGNYRHRTCPFPPIMINLSKTDMGYEDLSSIKNIKLVTHCRQSQLYEDYMLREYLAYKLYNVVTDFSFRVRLLKINYIDLGNKELTLSHFAFLIEPVDMLEARMNSVEVENVEVGNKNLEDGWADKVSMFQFLIGNTDWYIPLLHNFKIFKRYGVPDPRVIPVPYDFDYSGFVNTEYAVPRDDLNISEISERVYMGPCRSDEEWQVTLDEFEGYKETFIQIIRDFPYLDRATRKELVDYVESFYLLYRRDDILKVMRLNCIKITQ